MQIKWYSIQFFSPPNSQLCSQSPSSDCRIRRFPGQQQSQNHRMV